MVIHLRMSKIGLFEFSKNCVDLHAGSHDGEQLNAQFSYSKNSYIRTLNFEGQAAVGSYLMIMNSNIRLSDSQIGS